MYSCFAYDCEFWPRKIMVPVPVSCYLWQLPCYNVNFPILRYSIICTHVHVYAGARAYWTRNLTIFRQMQSFPLYGIQAESPHTLWLHDNIIDVHIEDAEPQGKLGLAADINIVLVTTTDQLWEWATPDDITVPVDCWSLTVEWNLIELLLSSAES